MDIRHVLRYSYHDARNALVMGTSAAALARARERAFVKAVASQFSDALAADDIRVFSPFARGNRDDFGAEKLLFDIEVCRLAFAETSDRKPEQFAFVSAALWQIEIEFSHEWRDVVFALNRLSCGAAENKLLIAAQRNSGQDEFLATIRPVVSACPGEVYLALVTQPSDWDDGEGSVDVFRLDADDNWNEV